MVAKRTPTIPQPGRTGRKPHPAFTVFGLFALLLVVAFGARRAPGAGTGGTLARLELSLGESLVALILIVGVLDVAFIIFSLWKRGHVVRLPPRRRGWMVRMLVFLAGFGILLAVLSVISQDPTEGPVPPESGEEAADAAQNRDVPWTWLILAGGLAGGLAAVWLNIPPNTAVNDARADSEIPAARAFAPDDGLWTYVVPTGDDPRSRVIQSYAAMEHALAGAGFSRRPSEAPLEFARRIISSRPDQERAVQDLTRLFVRARFSHHPVDLDMETRARAALELVVLEPVFGGDGATE